MADPMTEERTAISGPAAEDRPRPDEAWIRGSCPACGDVVVSNTYYVGGKGYVIVWECWASLQWPDATCDYRKVL